MPCSNVSQVLSSQCCPVFGDDGSIKLSDADGNTAEIAATGDVVVNLLGLSADIGNILQLGSDGRVYLPLSALPLVISGDADNLLQIGSDGKVFFDGAGLPIQGISSDALNVLLTGNDGLPFLSPQVIQANQTVTAIAYNPSSGILTYVNEAGTPIPLDLSNLGESCISADAGNLLSLGSDGCSFLSANDLGGLCLFSVTSGPDISTVAAGPQTMKVGDTLHLFSDGSIGFNVFPGSARIYADVQLKQGANLLAKAADGSLFFDPNLIPNTGVSAGAGNLLSIGADGLPFLSSAAVRQAESTTYLNPGPDPYQLVYTSEDSTQTVDLKRSEQVPLTLFGPGEQVSPGPAGAMFVVPSEYDSWTLQEINAAVLSADSAVTSIRAYKSSGGSNTVIGNIAIAGLSHNAVASTPAVLNTGDLIWFEILGASAVNLPKGLAVTLNFRN